MQPPSQLTDIVRAEWGRPVKVLCDRFRVYELEDCARGLRIEPRVMRYSEASADIRATRRMAKDGPLSVDRDSRLLLTGGLAVSMVENDASGNSRLVKRGSNNQARDDVAAALTLACGEVERAAARPPRRMTVGLVG